jgi:chromosome segregation ATPase
LTFPEGRVSELETSVQELEQTLVEGREEASEAIARWESHSSTLEERTAQLENELKAVAEERDELSLNMEKSVVRQLGNSPNNWQMNAHYTFSSWTLGIIRSHCEISSIKRYLLGLD